MATPMPPPAVKTTSTQSAKPTFPAIEFKGTAVPSIIPPDVKHWILAAGFYGSGKTTFVTGIDAPQNVLFLDFEAKGENIAAQLGIENYFAPIQDAMTLAGFGAQSTLVFDRVKQIMEAIPSGRFTTLILDGLSILQDGMIEKVKANPLAYGVGIENASTGKMGGAWPGVGKLLQAVANQARLKGIKVIGATAEVKAKWGAQGPILNKFEVKGQGDVHKMSILTVLMVPGLAENGGAPSALVLKEALAKFEWKDGRQVVTKRIPMKLPLATMSEVYRYLREPADYSYNPTTKRLGLRPDELPTEEEMEPFRPIVAKDQLSTYVKLLELAREGGGDAE